MYWGLVLKTNKRYSQEITKGFHVSNATLDLSTVDKDAVVSIWVHTDEADHLLCNLSKQIPQVALDLVFSEGETVAFYSKGNGTVHLNGNIMQDDDFGMDGIGDMGEEEELDEEADDEEVDYAALKKALKKETSAKAGKKSNEAEKEDAEEDSEDDEDDELDVEDEESDDEDDLDDEDEESDDEDDLDDEEEDEEEDEVQAPPSKKSKVEKEAKQNGVAINGKATQKQNDQQKKQKGTPQEQPKKEKKEQQPQQKLGKKTLSSGVVIEDLNTGKGPEATAGKRVTVYYIGRLQKNNKVFDSTQSGEGFKFHLGKNEVIRGWDIGVVGMRVGGKRRIVCPPHAAYGSKGAPPAIPGNATLVFDVTLRSIN